MEKNLIYSALAFREDNSARNLRLKGMSLIDGKEMYLRNAYVSLVSAKRFHGADIALITNLPLSERWAAKFQKEGIKIYLCPFDSYNLGKDYPWELAFYKLCVMRYVLSLGYENYLLVDSDTIFLRDPSPIFEEIQAGSVLLYEIMYGVRQPMRKLINNEYLRFNNAKEMRIISQWGGEFVGAAAANLEHLLNLVDKYFSLYVENNEKLYVIGDEFFISMAAADMRNVRNAGPYIERHGTRGNAYFASTRYSDNECIVIHLPIEKNLGLLDVYNYMIRHKKMPTINKIVRCCNLPRLRGHHLNMHVILMLARGLFRTIISRK